LKNYTYYVNFQHVIIKFWIFWWQIYRKLSHARGPWRFATKYYDEFIACVYVFQFLPSGIVFLLALIITLKTKSYIYNICVITLVAATRWFFNTVLDTDFNLVFFFQKQKCNQVCSNYAVKSKRMFMSVYHRFKFEKQVKIIYIMHCTELFSFLVYTR